MEQVKKFIVFSRPTTTTNTGFKEIELLIHHHKIVFNDEGKEIRCFQLRDVVGLKVNGDNQSNTTGAATACHCEAELCIFASDNTNNTKRKIKFVCFFFNSYETFERNRESAMECRRSIQTQCLINDRTPSMSRYQDNAVNDGADDEVTTTPIETQPPKLLVVINPFSGTKKGIKEYVQTVQPLLELAGITVEELLTTERPNHAKEFIQSFDFSRITGIVCVGGDGTLFELINGMMNRQDHGDVMTTPIGVIPTGSGNAVLSSLLYEQGEDHNVLNALHQIIRGNSKPVDVAMVTTATAQTSYIVQGLTWGLIADVDIESEILRFLGGDLRYQLGALKCILQKRAYPGKLSYLPVGNTTSVAVPNRQDGGLEENISTAAVHDKEQQVNEQQEMGNIAQQKDTQTPEDNAASDVAPRTLPAPHPPPADPASCIPPLSDPIPDNWVTIEEDFVSVLITLVPRLTSTTVAHPDVVLGDDTMHVVIIPYSVTRGGLLTALQGLETGVYVQQEGIIVLKTRACRIEPLTDSGRIVIDGEPVTYGRMQIQMADTKMNIFSLNL